MAMNGNRNASRDLALVICSVSLEGLVDGSWRFEPLHQTIDADRHELTMSTRRQPTEGSGGALHGGLRELTLPEARVRVAKVQIERREKLLASPIGHGLGVLYGQLVPLQRGDGGRLMACQEVRGDGCVKVITPDGPGLLEETQRFGRRTLYRHALGAERDDRIGRIHQAKSECEAFAFVRSLGRCNDS